MPDRGYGYRLWCLIAHRIMHKRIARTNHLQHYWCRRCGRRWVQRLPWEGGPDGQ
jgi:hypothetical protein